MKLWVEVLRPQHWIKSGFCLAALFFGGLAGSWESWEQILPLLVSFSVLASAGYLLNDVWNREEDRHHPRKKMRPVASGQLPVGQILLVSFALAIGGLALLGFAYGFVGESALPLWHGVGYLMLTIGYSLVFREMPLLDVLVLGIGFVIRVSAGAFALGLSPTGWLLGCTYAIALVLGFGKRLGEWRLLERLQEVPGETRSALRGYTDALLRVLVGGSSFAAGGTYYAYCLSHSEREFLVLTVIPVVVGLMAYLRMAWRSAVVETPERLLFKSPVLLGSVVVWLIMIVLIILR
ncbi:UbiA prenyltransferase family protein [Roseibacillus persicicus]|nr:UbiA prenyltransferase family protein [Roseibacillus persicicus]